MGGQSGISPKICRLEKGLNTALINLVSITAIVSHNKVHLFFPSDHICGRARQLMLPLTLSGILIDIILQTCKTQLRCPHRVQASISLSSMLVYLKSDSFCCFCSFQLTLPTSMLSIIPKPSKIQWRLYSASTSRSSNCSIVYTHCPTSLLCSLLGICVTSWE